MDPKSLLAQARDVMTVRQVFGEPIEREGLTIIPVAKVMGGGGGGSSSEPGGAGGEAEQTGEETNVGAGFGMRAVPAGVYVIKGDSVSWQPALDLNRVILGGQIVGVVLFLVIRSIVGVLARRREG